MSANGKPNRKRTCVAPTVPRLAVSSRCIALRAVWPAAASTGKKAQSQEGSIMIGITAASCAARSMRGDAWEPRASAWHLRYHHVVDVGIRRELPAIGNEIVDH